MTQKILVTLGPSSMSESVVKRCSEYGVHLFRINLSHTPLADVAPAIEKVPFLQRKIIATARQRNTPVFVATNLLVSLVTRRSPTRAEVNDVVSTLLMGADGLVLAAETAIGKYPVEAVGMVRRLIDESAIWMQDASIPEILET